MGEPSAQREPLTPEQWELLLATYQARQALMTTNEELGERRLQVFLTVVGAAGVGLGLAVERSDGSVALWVAAGFCGFLTLFGFATNARVARRDVATSLIKEDLYRIREYVANHNADLITVLPHMNGPGQRYRRRPWLPHKGGLVELIGVLTASFAGIGLLLAGYATWNNVALAVAIGIVGMIALWVLQIWVVRCTYISEDCLADAPKPAATFRGNVGIVVKDASGLVLVLQRTDHPDSWQFPQGGINKNEAREHAAYRELEEETGLSRATVSVAQTVGRWLVYEIPAETRSKFQRSKHGLGQVQWWFLMSHPSAQPQINLPKSDKKHQAEFCDFEWVSFDEAVRRVVAFKRPVYDEVQRAFDPDRSGS